MCYKSCIFSLTLCIELQIWMNVTKGPIIVILMQLAIILQGAIVARATLDLRAMVFLAQVITSPFLISSLELYVSKSSVQFSSIEGTVGTYFNLCKLGVCVCLCVWGAYVRDKNTFARFCVTNSGRGGGVFVGHHGI